METNNLNGDTLDTSLEYLRVREAQTPSGKLRERATQMVIVMVPLMCMCEVRCLIRSQFEADAGEVGRRTNSLAVLCNQWVLLVIIYCIYAVTDEHSIDSWLHTREFSVMCS